MNNVLSTITLLATAAVAVMLAAGAAATELRPFASDACSAFPDGTPSQQTLWLHCCMEHDIAYWAGGTRRQRHAADAALKQCVAATGEPAIANLMLAGVRVGGTPYLPTSFRWGYGWPYPRGYKALSKSERDAVETGLRAEGLRE